MKIESQQYKSMFIREENVNTEGPFSLAKRDII